MKKWLCIAVIAAVAVTAVSAAQAQQAGRWPRFWERKKAVENLALTPDQVSRLAAIDLKYTVTAVELQAKAKVAKLNFDYLIGKGDMNEKTIADLIAQIADARKEQTAQGLQRMVEVRKILTPEQWEKVSRMLTREASKRREGGREEKGPGMKGGEGMSEGKEGRGAPGHGQEGRPMMGGRMGGMMGGPGEKSEPAGHAEE